jgi:hypothetical protein
MESNPFMSRRDIVINTVLGFLIVAIFLFPFLLFAVVAEYILRALNLSVGYLFPGTANLKVVILAVFLIVSLVSAVGQVWKRRWRNAFLSFAMLPLFASVCLADAHSLLGLRGPFWIFGLLPIFAIPEASGPTRSQFLLVASTICAVIAINTGLLGSGLVARIIAGCVLVGLALWFIIDVRQRDAGPTNPGPQAPLSPTGV